MQLTYNNQLRTETDPAIIATLRRKGWTETAKTAHDDATEAPAEWQAGEWTVRKLTAEELAARARKVWKNAAQFFQQFTEDQRYAIEVSVIPAIVVLRAELKLWSGEVWSDNRDILRGLDSLEEAGIVTAAERQQKFT